MNLRNAHKSRQSECNEAKEKRKREDKANPMRPKRGIKREEQVEELEQLGSPLTPHPSPLTARPAVSPRRVLEQTEEEDVDKGSDVRSELVQRPMLRARSCSGTKLSVLRIQC
jgi:hypothetical protein